MTTTKMVRYTDLDGVSRTTERVDTQGFQVPRFCSYRITRGCVGRILIEKVSYRGKDGVLTDRLVWCCNRCGAAHGGVVEGNATK